jgi:hypothetical protein
MVPERQAETDDFSQRLRRPQTYRPDRLFL